MQSNKFKDRLPKETIDLVSNFFDNKNFIINTTINRSEAGTFSSAHELLYENKIIITSNGKGTTEEYCLASGLMEMYERFCSKIQIALHPYRLAELKNNHNNKYYFDNNEKTLNIKQILSNPIFLELKNSLFINDNDFQDYLNLLYPNYIPGLAYHSLNTNKTEYMNPSLIHLLQGSTGLAAGNTLEEAIVQGISELCERHVVIQIMNLNQNFNTYYKINHSILNKDLQTIISNIEAKNYNVFIFDLSFNFNLPVCLAVLMHKNTKQIHYDFGAHPIFDIAVERCLTELYQGCKTFTIPSLVRPFNTVPPFEAIYKSLVSCQLNNFLPENILLNAQEIMTYNTNGYAPNTYNNKQLLDWFKQYTNTYYCDMSLSTDIYAVSLYDPFLSQTHLQLLQSCNFYIATKQKGIQTIKVLNNYFLDIKNNKEPDTKLLITTLSNIAPFSPEEKIVNALMGGGDWLCPIPYSSINCYQILLKITRNWNPMSLDTIESLRNYLFVDIVIKYYLIKIFLLDNDFSLQELKTLFNVDITNYDISIVDSLSNLFIEIYNKPMHQYLTSSQLDPLKINYLY